MAALDAGGATQQQVATRFSVSLCWVRKLPGQRRRIGYVESLGPRGGAPRRLDEQVIASECAVVTARSDIALKELRLRLADANGCVRVPTIYRVIETPGLATPKKDVP